MGWLLGGSFVVVATVLAACVAVLLSPNSLPNPQIDWDNEIIPMAVEYGRRVATVPSLKNKTEKPDLSNAKDEEETYVTADVESTEMESSSSETVSKTEPLRDVVIVITGATSGIGLSLAKALYHRLGARKIVAIGRSASKLAKLQAEMPSITTVQADLLDLDSVNQAANKILQDPSVPHIDILINNAGLYGHGTNWEFPPVPSPQGYDRVFATNYLSHFLLTEKLLPALFKSKQPTILQSSSGFHFMSHGIDLLPYDGNNKIVAAQPGGNHGYIVFREGRSYANSKLAQILHTRALNKKYPSLRAVSFEPAWVGTNIGQTDFNNWALNTLGFESDGWGIVSGLYAIFYDGPGDYFGNTDIVRWAFVGTFKVLPRWAYPGIVRDLLVNSLAGIVLFVQRFFPNIKESETSPESYREDLIDGLYAWSYDAVSKYL